MTTRAETISELIEKAPAGAGLPVIFNGLVPRCIGRAEDHSGADVLLIANRLSATFVSRALVFGRRCIIAHG